MQIPKVFIVARPSFCAAGNHPTFIRSSQLDLSNSTKTWLCHVEAEKPTGFCAGSRTEPDKSPYWKPPASTRSGVGGRKPHKWPRRTAYVPPLRGKPKLHSDAGNSFARTGCALLKGNVHQLWQTDTKSVLPVSSWAFIWYTSIVTTMHLKTSKIDSSVKRLHCLVLEVRHGYYPEIVVANMSIYQINRTRSEPHGTFGYFWGISTLDNSQMGRHTTHPSFLPSAQVLFHQPTANTNSIWPDMQLLVNVEGKIPVMQSV